MYDIKYSIIKVEIEFKNNSNFNINKQSAIRGIIGNTLIEENCLLEKNNRNCEDCYLNSKCLSHNIFSPKINQGGESSEVVSPFIIICDDKREKINKSDKLSFAMTFFGDMVVYIPTIIRSIEKAGIEIGLEGNLYKLTKVLNDKNKEIFINGEMSLKNVSVRKINEYISNRLMISEEVNRIEIVNPIRYKKNKKFQDDLNEEDIINLIFRRLQVISALDTKIPSIEFINREDISFNIKKKSLCWREFNRYSYRQKSSMSLGGVVGYLDIENVNCEAKKMLIAGELIHIGKSTSFGLGDYILY